MIRFLIVLFAFLSWLPGLAKANPSNNAPIGLWSFDSEESTPFQSHGNVARDQTGPRPPEFPDFDADNTALKFSTGYVNVSHQANDDDFGFRNGDEITIEAWVQLDSARDGQQCYVIGKGRTGAAEFAPDNQNWAMRTVAQKGVVKISFLFATARTSNGSHWHRWTSLKGFEPSSGWHHIAVAYRFGDPSSVQGWIDGISTTGKWDMGGPTKEPPVVDDDDVWIGSSRGGAPSNSFQGKIDEVAVHRRVLSDKTIASRYHRVGGPRLVGPAPEVMPDLGRLPGGQVRVSLAEKFPSNARWLNDGEKWPEENLVWQSGEFLLPRIPVCYDDWGIRDSWSGPLVLRMAADVKLPAGTHPVLMRARSLGRLWIDGEIVTRTVKNPHGGGNLQPIVPIADPPVAGARIVRFPQQEVFGEIKVTELQAQTPVRVVVELVVGGKGYRSESGEVCVAFQPHGSGEFFVLASNPSMPLTDVSVEPRLTAIESEVAANETRWRREKAASQDEFWTRRHDFARDHTAIQGRPKGKSTAKTIDQFINSKIEQVRKQSNQHNTQTTERFHHKVLPILQEHCFRCHGEKRQGGLRLDSRQAALSAGESELPAVVPGDAEASEMIVQVRDGAMPPTEHSLSKSEIETLENWVRDGAAWPSLPIDPSALQRATMVDDSAFLRRVYFDTVGVPPSPGDVREFLRDSASDRRERVIDMLLSDDRYAGHWVSFWMDLLAENPTLLNVSMGSTGPFRWFLHDALRDNKSLDRMVTELVLMRGSSHDGGSAGFGIAGENDAPMAAKAHILASAFLGIEMQCARCHDSPFHSTTQEDLFSLSAMLKRKPAKPPATSRVPAEFFEKQTRESLIRVTLKPDSVVQPNWPLARFTGVEDSPQLDEVLMQPDDARERLAALITHPDNTRFAKVMVNHLWKRLIGAGIVEPVDDWEGASASHPELLSFLADELVCNDYDLKHVLRLILNSSLYQSEAIGQNEDSIATQRFFVAPDRRRLSAEQIVDALFVASGRTMDVEELTFVHDGTLPMSKRLTLGTPQRAWQFAGLNNERDRPSLSMPRGQSIVDVLEAFGWTGTRQKPISQRDTDPNVLQPGILANGTLTMSLSRAAHGSELANMAVDAVSSNMLVKELFLRFLGRLPNHGELETFGRSLEVGFANRVLSADRIASPDPDPPLPQSTWTNHLQAEANQIQKEWERRVRRGPPVDPRLQTDWRERYEDAVWSLINHREFVWIP